MNIRKPGTAVLLLTAASVTAAWAHHSFAMFAENTVSISGNVRTLEWTNPHVWLWVDVTGADGKIVPYAFEGAAPGEMSRMSGWTKRSVTKGEKVSVQYRPLRDGRPGGTLGRVTRADGSVIGNASGGRGPGGPRGGGGPPPGAGQALPRS